MCKIVIQVEGGLVQQIYASDSEADVVVVDLDTEGCSPSDPEIVSYLYGNRPRQAYVCRWTPEPLEALGGSEVEAAIEAADHLHPYSARELTTMLVALRAWQSLLRREGKTIVRAYPHFDDQPPLEAPEIDALCERLNEGVGV